MKKNIVMFMAALVVVAAAVLIAKDVIAKNVVTAGVRAVLGIPMEIDNLNVGIFDTSVRIEGLTIYNPDGFVDHQLAYIPLIYVDYELWSALKGKLHCTLVELDIKKITIVRNKEGEVNINRLKSISSAKEEAVEQKSAGRKSGRRERGIKKSPEKSSEIQIDKLILTVDTVIYKNYERRGKPAVKQFSVGIDHEEFENITNLNQIVRVVIVRVLKQTGLGNIGVAVGTLVKGLKNIGLKTVEILKDVGGSILDIFRK